jgi:hypothetical protein
MGLKAIPNVYSVSCDSCGDGFDTIGEYGSIKEQLDALKNKGWKGSRKNLICPKCITNHRKTQGKG